MANQLKMTNEGISLDKETIINFAVEEIDAKIETPFLNKFFQKEISNFEFRGIRPMISFFTKFLILSWLMMVIIFLIRTSMNIEKLDIVIILLYLSISVILYLNEHREP
jgi:hypothetical protein